MIEPDSPKQRSGKTQALEATDTKVCRMVSYASDPDDTQDEGGSEQSIRGERYHIPESEGFPRHQTEKLEHLRQC